MSPLPDSGDRKILTLAGVLLLALVGISVLLSPPGRQDSPGFPSSYSAGSSGAKAAFLLLKDLGYQVERWERPAIDLPASASGTVLILADPFVPATEADRSSLRRFTQAGGRVLATGIRGGGWLPEALVKSLDKPDFEWKTHPAVAASPLTHAAPEIVLQPEAAWRAKNPSHVFAYGGADNPVVVTYRRGAGRVVWWAGATPLTNAGIQQADNLALLLNSLGPPERTRVLWDEYYHGQTGSLWSYLARTPLPWGLAQIALLFLGVCFTFARRRGPLRPLIPKSRLSPLEFAETLGDLYRHSKAAPATVATAYQHFRFLLSRHLGLPARATAEQLHRGAARQLNRRDADLLRVLQRCERASDRAEISENEALYLIQALQDYATLLRLAPRTYQESRDARTS